MFVVIALIPTDVVVIERFTSSPITFVCKSSTGSAHVTAVWHLTLMLQAVIPLRFLSRPLRGFTAAQVYDAVQQRQNRSPSTSSVRRRKPAGSMTAATGRESGDKDRP